MKGHCTELLHTISFSHDSFFNIITCEFFRALFVMHLSTEIPTPPPPTSPRVWYTRWEQTVDPSHSRVLRERIASREVRTIHFSIVLYLLLITNNMSKDWERTLQLEYVAHAHFDDNIFFSQAMLYCVIDTSPTKSPSILHSFQFLRGFAVPVVDWGWLNQSSGIRRER